jgi:hypothetical protein
MPPAALDSIRHRTAPGPDVRWPRARFRRGNAAVVREPTARCRNTSCMSGLGCIALHPSSSDQASARLISHRVRFPGIVPPSRTRKSCDRTVSLEAKPTNHTGRIVFKGTVRDTTMKGTGCRIGIGHLARDQLAARTAASPAGVRATAHGGKSRPGGLVRSFPTGVRDFPTCLGAMICVILAFLAGHLP